MNYWNTNRITLSKIFSQHGKWLYLLLMRINRYRSTLEGVHYSLKRGNYTRNSKRMLTGLLWRVKQHDILFADIDYKNCCFTIYFSDKNVV